MDFDEPLPGSKAERELAHSLGIEITSDMTQADLSRLISAAPASKAQREFAEALLKQELPASATFGQVRRLLNALLPLKNQTSLAVTGWEVGDVLLWRGTYYQIAKILVKLRYRMLLEPVDLEPGGKGEPANIVRGRTPKEWRYPITLEEDRFASLARVVRAKG